MAVYATPVITTVGESLIADSIAGGGTIKFTNLVTSSYAYPAGTDFTALTSLQDVVQTEQVDSVARENTTDVRITTTVMNTGISGSYVLRNIGIYAAPLSGTGDDVLLMVVQATVPDTIPDPADQLSAINLRFLLTISNTATVQIFTNPAGSVTFADLDAYLTGVTDPFPNHIYVNKDSENVEETGSITSPFKTMSAAINYVNNATKDVVVEVSAGLYVDEDMSIFLNPSVNCMFKGSGTFGERLTGWEVPSNTLVLTDNAVSLGFENFVFLSQCLLGMSSPDSRIAINNCVFEVTGTDSFGTTSATAGSIVIGACLFFGDSSLHGTNSARFRLYLCDFANESLLYCLSSGTSYQVNACTNIAINHSGGALIVGQGTQFKRYGSSAYGVISTATGTANPLVLLDCDFLLRDGTYASILQSSASGYYLVGRVSHEPNIDSFNGNRIDGGMHADDIFIHHTWQNISPADETVKGALIALDDEFTSVNDRLDALDEKTENLDIESVRPYKIVIGTTTSGHTADEVDFLCTGLNDNIIISQAINALGTIGRLIFREGSYNLANTVVLPSNVISIEIEGASNGATVINLTTTALPTNGAFSFPTISGSTPTATTMKNFKISNVTFTSASTTASHTGYYLTFRYCTNVSVVNCRFSSITGAGHIYIPTYTSSATYLVENVLISGCKFENYSASSGGSSQSFNAIFSRSFSQVIIEDCVFNISYQSETTQSSTQKNTVIYMYVISTISNASSLSFENNSTMISNCIFNCKRGYYVISTHNTVNFSAIGNNASNSVPNATNRNDSFVQYTLATSDTNSCFCIANNIIVNFGLAHGNVGSSNSANVISNNSVKYTFTLPHTQAIDVLSPPSSCVVSGNSFYGWGNTNRVINAKNRNVIIGNYFYATSQINTDVSSAGSGIFTNNGSLGVVIMGNFFYGYNYGIWSNSTDTYTRTVVGNCFQNCNTTINNQGGTGTNWVITSNPQSTTPYT